MMKFAVTAVNIGEGSDFQPKLVALVDSIFQAKNAVKNHLDREIAEVEDQSGIIMEIDNTGLHAADDTGMCAIQMNIQMVNIDVCLDIRVWNLYRYNLNMKSFRDYLKTNCVESILKVNGNAYSSSRYLAKNIKFDINRMIASSNDVLTENIDIKFGDRSKGGIILFSVEVNANEQNKNKIIDYICKNLKRYLISWHISLR